MRKGTVRGIISKDNKVAVIKRIREKDGKIREYYVLPGGGVEGKETLEQAMHREAKEELGVEIKIDGTLYKFVNMGELNHFMLCEVTDGEFGTGTGPEYTSKDYSDRGQYIPMLLSREEIQHINLVPNEIRDKIVQDTHKDKILEQLKKVIEDRCFFIASKK